MRLAPQGGQKPRLLQEKATGSFSPQPSQDRKDAVNAVEQKVVGVAGETFSL
jgi:hypothetical protein